MMKFFQNQKNKNFQNTRNVIKKNRIKKKGFAERQAEEQASRVVLFDVMCSYLKRIGGVLLHLLRSTRSKKLTEHEQNLCVELASSVATIASNVPYLHFSKNLTVQSHCVDMCMERLLPPVMVRCAVAIILYDIQYNHASAIAESGKEKHSKHARKKFSEIQQRLLKFKELRDVQQAHKMNVMRRTASHVLSDHLVRTPGHKYSVLEAFIQSEVFSKQPIRMSYLSELMESMNLGKYIRSTLVSCYFKSSFY